MKAIAAVICAALITACSEKTEQQNAANGPPENAAESPAVPPAENNQANAVLPDDRTPLPEPKGPIDPKSAEAAGQVVQHYGALIEQKRWRESWTLWSNLDAAREFDRNWRNEPGADACHSRPRD